MAQKANQPSFKILICLIEIWDAGDSTDLAATPEAPMMITEVERIEINDTYKNLFCKAKVDFPRGTIIRKTITEGNLLSNQVTANIDDVGVLETTRTNTFRASVKNFEVGQRIRIRLGYTTDPNIAKHGKTASPYSIFNDPTLRRQYIQAMTPAQNDGSQAIMFDGYITKCSIDEPISLECEDLASKLKKISCPPISPSQSWTVNDFFAEGGKWDLLKKSGLKLHPDTKDNEIKLGKIQVPEGFTVADVLTTWAKNAHLYSFIRPDNNGYPCLEVGRAYFSNPGKDNIMRKGSPVDIDFAYNVADNNLTMMETDKAFLAVSASCWETIDGKGKKYSITIRKNPEYDSSDPKSKPYQILNETRISKKAMRAGATSLTNTNQRVDLSTYTIIPYFSSHIGISHEDLQEEAIKYFESYNCNGVEGTLTLFGDFNLKSATKVHLNDKRFPAKNGYYLVDEVTTEFGVKGYRQTIKLPYCISRDAKNKEK